MITSNLANRLGATGPIVKYFLTTCSGGKEEKSGRRISGVVLPSLTGIMARLPQLVECANIPEDKREIATPEMARQFLHLKEIADPKESVEILIGRDAPELLKIRASRNGPKGAPWAQKLDLGWTISGQMCLDRVGAPVHISAHRTSLERLGRLVTSYPRNVQASHHHTEESEIVPCPNHFEVKERYAEKGEIGDNLFQSTPGDNSVIMSQEDKSQQGNWEMPLPFRSPTASMPNNRPLAVNRLNGLLRTLNRKPKMKEYYFQFMGKVFERGYAVPVPQYELLTPNDHSNGKEPLKLTESEREQKAGVRGEGRTLYLPHFGVYHPRKPDQIRVVFDSPAEFQGVSLNKELLPGPDLMNSLVEVLIRFRQDNIAVMCDIEQMFHSFHVDPKHQNFLRFLWFKDNDPSKRIIENKMTVHLFGNGPSPAIATFGLRKTLDDGEERYGKETRDFVHRNFYVNDGLTSRPT